MTDISKTIRDFVNRYELRGDEGDYTPHEAEKMLIEDALQGFVDEFYPEKEREISRLREALQKIIQMNVQYCIDKHGDATQADSMSCVVIARAALSKQEG